MSVILYEDEKFLRVAKSLKFRSRDIAHLWLYPENWDKQDGMDETIEKFAQDLRNANIDAYDVRYTEDEETRELDFEKWTETLTIYELIKSLKGIVYNCVESNLYNETKDQLEKVIYFLMGILVDMIPEYKAAETW